MKNNDFYFKTQITNLLKYNISILSLSSTDVHMLLIRLVESHDKDSQHA